MWVRRVVDVVKGSSDQLWWLAASSASVMARSSSTQGLHSSIPSRSVLCTSVRARCSNARLVELAARSAYRSTAAQRIVLADRQHVDALVQPLIVAAARPRANQARRPLAFGARPQRPRRQRRQPAPAAVTRRGCGLDRGANEGLAGARRRLEHGRFERRACSGALRGEALLESCDGDLRSCRMSASARNQRSRVRRTLGR